MTGEPRRRPSAFCGLVSIAALVLFAGAVLGAAAGVAVVAFRLVAGG